MLMLMSIKYLHLLLGLNKSAKFVYGLLEQLEYGPFADYVIQGGSNINIFDFQTNFATRRGVVRVKMVLLNM